MVLGPICVLFGATWSYLVVLGPIWWYLVLFQEYVAELFAAGTAFSTWQELEKKVLNGTFAPANGEIPKSESDAVNNWIRGGLTGQIPIVRSCDFLTLVMLRVFSSRASFLFFEEEEVYVDVQTNSSKSKGTSKGSGKDKKKKKATPKQLPLMIGFNSVAKGQGDFLHKMTLSLGCWAGKVGEIQDSFGHTGLGQAELKRGVNQVACAAKVGRSSVRFNVPVSSSDSNCRRTTYLCSHCICSYCGGTGSSDDLVLHE